MKLHKLIHVCVIMVVTIICCIRINQADARTLYVNNSLGNDSYNGLYDSYQGDDNGPKATIQQAIDAAINGDIILVADGHYTGQGNRDIDFGGKIISLSSVNGPENCIIDSQAGKENQHRGFIFHSGEDPNALVSGFTITGGNITAGGGIYCTTSSPSIVNCIIKYNKATGTGPSVSGGGISCDFFSRPIIQNCQIIKNESQNWGGAIACDGNTHLTLVNSIISGNWSKNYGGGLYCKNSQVTIINCDFTGNSSYYYGGGIWLTIGSRAKIVNTIIWYNNIRETGYPGPEQLAMDETSDLQLHHCDIEGNAVYIFGGLFAINGADNIFGAGNIGDNPEFVNAGSWTPDSSDPNNWIEGDYHLDKDSPCVNAGNNDASLQYDTDIDGNNRIIGIVDMGPYESKGELLAEFTDIAIPQPMAPGDKGKITLTIKHFRNQLLNGSMTVELYLSKNQILDSSDVLIGTTQLKVKKLPRDHPVTANLTTLIPNKAQAGQYYLLANIETDAATAGKELRFTASTRTKRNLTWEFGDIASRKNTRLTVQDSQNNPVCFMLKGGWGKVIGGKNFDEIRLYNTDIKSSLSIKTKGKVFTSIGNIKITNGSLGAISAKTTDLRGSIIADGCIGKVSLHNIPQTDTGHTIQIKGIPADDKVLLSLQCNRVSDLSIQSEHEPIGSIAVVDWLNTDGTADTIYAPRLSKLSTKGDKKTGISGNFEADINLCGPGDTKGLVLGNVKIAGDINNSAWNITGTDNQPGTTIVGKVSVNGKITASSIVINGDTGSITVGAICNGSIVFIGPATEITTPSGKAEDFYTNNNNTGYYLKSLSIKGTTDNKGFNNSKLAAWGIGSLKFPKNITPSGYIQYSQKGAKLRLTTGITWVDVTP